MSNIVDIEFIGRGGIVETDNVSFTFETSSDPREFDQNREQRHDLAWLEGSFQVGQYNVYPYGSNDNLPKLIRDVVKENYIAPGILKKKVGLLWGKGPKLYIEKIDGGQLVREWVDDPEVMAWLESWDFEAYVQKAVVDTTYSEGHFTKIYRNRGARIGHRPMISRLEHMNMNQARLAAKKVSKSNTPTHVVFTVDQTERDYILADYKVYPLFDPTRPFAHANSVSYSNMYSFCSDYYSVPDIYGSLEWLRRSSSIPMILKALSKNSMNLKYHVISPQIFWDKKAEEIKRAKEENGQTYTSADLMTFKRDFLKKIADTLSDVENTGKFWHSVKHFEIQGHNLVEQGWEIKPLEQKVKDFISAQETISDISGRAISTGLGLHQSIGGSGERGKTDGGGEQLYALKNYLLTSNDIPESIVLKAINMAIRANWPEKKVRLGFYHVAPQKEQDISPSKRFKEQL